MRIGAMSLVHEIGVRPESLREAVPQTVLQHIGFVSCHYWQTETLTSFTGDRLGLPGEDQYMQDFLQTPASNHPPRPALPQIFNNKNRPESGSGEQPTLSDEENQRAAEEAVARGAKNHPRGTMDKSSTSSSSKTRNR